ncbi:NUDIX domain-containing protein [Clostridium fermenticellae]|uniref:NUDIX domain-containing protein n=1 Tax=Clostridium fermenticellae TaxID=2068654 RepID=A0A386H1T7_9CLOT|nr:NUDIX domain-containing protein [Clostridium fermenticellae]AYD39608.1 NUDIX domain-containing protein [Clostridium fermenticellae]AYD39626.1 NUDIX domain-containing protein [Clostridium fermenticellae]
MDDNSKSNILEKLDKLRAIFSSVEDQSKNIEKEHDGIYMFFSFDIVNSTSFKEKFQDKWRGVISAFYDISEKVMTAVINNKEFSKIETWKYVGDEILFYKKLSSRKELLWNVRCAYYAQELIYKKLCDSDEDKIVKPNIHIKTTVWIGKCSEKTNDSKNQIYASYEKVNNEEKYGAKTLKIDFLGPDIDAGFRISKYAEKGKLVVSAKLACLLYKLMIGNDEILTSEEKMIIKSCLKIVSYEQLKGVWGNRHYPIVWFDHNWDRPNDMFDYDDYFISKIARNILTCNSEFEKSIYTLDILPKVYDDINRENDIDDILDYLEKLENGEIKREMIDSTRKNYVNSEVHCVAMCFYNNEEVFVAKRSNNRKRFKGAWDLGYGKINNNEKWTECLKKEYKENFDLDLKFEEDITPIATYYLNKDGIIIPGIIFAADVEKKQEKLNTVKYSEVAWVKIKDIDEFFNDKDTVDKLVYNIKKAVKIRQLQI